MSAQEAAWFLLKLGMSAQSRDSVSANTAWPEHSIRAKKTNEMDTEGLDVSSTDVFQTSVRERMYDQYGCLPDICTRRHP
ncbi:hypothetical protein HPB49_011511 [Dermacentor silvarum]|uniref:Uncharacterized protein n=1 Tax=Dermacentor silvarum TaxID=543639 RepID=A0ACB8CWY2_DERSI|nr:hypothetical protein HPB49_011511 [Dermacentor silvarum]